jgi:hypothetical protein
MGTARILASAPFPKQVNCAQGRGLRNAPEEAPCIQVRGKRLDTETGIRTRLRAATQQERYEAVPAPVQIFVLLADMLIEAREGALECSDSQRRLPAGPPVLTSSQVPAVW